MGDNFGPQFGAALQMENGTDVSDPYGCYLAPTDRKNGETRPETLYKDDNRVARAAKCDNVLNFMMRAGYRAVVPGREDFMYTSRWLRVSALLLKQAGQGATEIRNPDHALYLLGANLRIASSGGGQAEPSGESKPEQPGKGQGAAPQGNKYSLKGRCPLLFADAPFGADSTPCYSAGQPERSSTWSGWIAWSRVTGTTPSPMRSKAWPPKARLPKRAASPRLRLTRPGPGEHLSYCMGRPWSRHLPEQTPRCSSRNPRQHGQRRDPPRPGRDRTARTGEYVQSRAHRPGCKRHVQAAG